jgi:hypothetical protein
MFVLMMQGHPLSVALPEDPGLGERFWYWRGASGRSYIHSIYRRDLCPAVPGAVFVIVRVQGGSRRAVSAGRFTAEAMANASIPSEGRPGEEEIHIHLLARDEEGAMHVLGDLLAAMHAAPQPACEPRLHVKPVQLDLLAA